MPFRIKGLKDSKPLKSLPDDILWAVRHSPYDEVIVAAKEQIMVLTFDSDKRAANAYLTLKGRVKKLGEKVSLAKRGDKVYLYPPKMKPAH